MSKQHILKIGVCACTPFLPGTFHEKEVIIKSLDNRELPQPYHFTTREIRIPEKEHDKTLRAYLCQVFLEGRTGPNTIGWLDVALLDDRVHTYYAGMTRITNTLIPYKRGEPPSVVLVMKRVTAIIEGSYWFRGEQGFIRWLEWMKQENIYPELENLIPTTR